MCHGLGNLVAGVENKKFFVIEINLCESGEEKMISKMSRFECHLHKFSCETAIVSSATKAQSHRLLKPFFRRNHFFLSWLINCH